MWVVKPLFANFTLKMIVYMALETIVGCYMWSHKYEVLDKIINMRYNKHVEPMHNVTDDQNG